MAETSTTKDGSTTPVPSFAGFSDFDLDLSCLSPPASPNNSQSGMPASPSTPSTPRSSKSTSFLSAAPPVSEGRLARKVSPTLMVPPSVATTVIRGSWPLIRYVGRGTPVDKTRRVEWGTLGGEEATEDGLLFSHMRSASLDSVTRPSGRSSSHEWTLLGQSSSTQSTSTAQTHGFIPRSKSRLFEQPPPELAPLSIGKDSSEEWTSLMHEVLRSTTPGAETSDTVPPGQETEEKQLVEEEEKKPEKPALSALEGEAGMTPEEIRQLDMELGNNLGLNEALNLGLSLRSDTMNLFNIGIIPSSGRDTPSVYPSEEGSVHASRPPTVHVLEVLSNGSATTQSVAHRQSPVSVHGAKRTSRSWWRRVIKNLRRAHSLLHPRHPKQT